MGAEKKEKRGKISFTSPDSGGSMKRFCVTVFVMAVIVLVFIAVALQTEAGNAEVQRRLSKLAGMPVTVERASIGFPYELVLDGVQTDGFDNGTAAGLRIEEARVSLKLNGQKKVRMRGCSLLLEEEPDGRWKPEILARMGELPLRSVDGLSVLTSGIRESYDIDISEATIKWGGAAGEGAMATKIDFKMSRIKMPRQLMYHYYISVFKATGPAGFNAHDVEREWLASERDTYIELSRSRDDETMQGVAFWEKAEPTGDDE